MLETITPVRFHAAVSSGRTKPSRIECLKSDGNLVEVVAKCSAGCDRAETGLAMEVVAACLAVDLGLPVPKAYLLDMDPAFIATIPDPKRRQAMAASNPIAFGSTEVGNGFRIWSKGDRISDRMLPDALAIFCFDAFVVNDDRRDANPNCLVRGDELRVIDHESAFVYKMLVSWQPPWEMGSLAALATSGHHIFYAGLKGRAMDLAPIKRAWEGITDGCLQDYASSIPHQWAVATAAVADAISLIQGVRENILAALAEVRRLLI
jgi:hypothetical protein